MTVSGLHESMKAGARTGGYHRGRFRMCRVPLDEAKERFEAMRAGLRAAIVFGMPGRYQVAARGTCKVPRRSKPLFSRSDRSLSGTLFSFTKCNNIRIDAAGHERRDPPSAPPRRGLPNARGSAADERVAERRARRC